MSAADAARDAAALAGEDDLIARHFRPIAADPGAFALSDDAACISVRDGHDLVVTVDAVVANVHFLPDDPPDAIARKALRVNLSDLAAKGATPRGFVLTLALERRDDAWLATFARALGEDAATFACPLLGGDTVRTPGPLTISITAFGEVPSGAMVRRAGAQPGDIVVVSGTIGDAALGLRLLRGDIQLALPLADRDWLISRYRVPQPRLAMAPCVARHFHAAMDLSDGLAGDLARLCRASGVSARINVDDVPLSTGARQIRQTGPEEAREWIMVGGDDYEILGTVAPLLWPQAEAAARAAGVALTPIGTIVGGDGPPVFVDAAGAPVSVAATPFTHF